MAQEVAKMTQVLAVFAVIGMAFLVWLAYGWLLLPGRCPVRTMVNASGDGDGLEQTVKSLLWLRRSGLLQGEIAICDAGLSQSGLLIAMTLARQNGVEFCGRVPEL